MSKALLSKIAVDLPALDPTSLDGDAERAERQLLQEGASRNTMMSYRSAIRYWSGWFELRYEHPFRLPLSTESVIQFIVDHAERATLNGLASEMPPHIDQALVDAGIKANLGALSLNTLLHRLSVLSKAHTVNQLTNPCHDSRVRELVSKTRSAYVKRGNTPHKKKALTRTPLEQLLATCDTSLRGKRDRALLLFAWSSGGRRRTEVTQANLANVVATDHGYVYTLGYSKTNQRGVERADRSKPITGPAAQALADWLKASGIKDGAIFRRIRRGDRLGEPLAPAAVRDIVRKRCVLAGLKGDFSAHSLRSGFITEAARQDVPLGDIMAMTGQTSIATVMGYYQAGRLSQSKALKLLD